jgi:hypothetical protein
MFVLIGVGYWVEQQVIGGEWHDIAFEEQVALFTTEKKARVYAEHCRLKTEIRRHFSAPQVFKKKSPMSSYTSYRIETHEETVLEIDPKVR